MTNNSCQTHIIPAELHIGLTRVNSSLTFLPWGLAKISLKPVHVGHIKILFLPSTPSSEQIIWIKCWFTVSETLARGTVLE